LNVGRDIRLIAGNPTAPAIKKIADPFEASSNEKKMASLRLVVLAEGSNSTVGAAVLAVPPQQRSGGGGIPGSRIARPARRPAGPRGWRGRNRAALGAAVGRRAEVVAAAHAQPRIRRASAAPATTTGQHHIGKRKKSEKADEDGDRQQDDSQI
jgi:hypothetical protein